jgi:L,D-transpeptidase YbiS
MWEARPGLSMAAATVMTKKPCFTSYARLLMRRWSYINVKRSRFRRRRPGATLRIRCKTLPDNCRACFDARFTGEHTNSECTPRGRHRIRAKIGAGCAPNTVFIRRRPTGELYTQELKRQYPKRDWILTRILWLCGEEPGRNRLGEVDSMRRYICPDEDRMGVPSSHGCVKMRNDDMIRLFDRVPVGTPVVIQEVGFG